MKLKWTPAQAQAVCAPVSDILVTAAAGSGKTQVLTGRIIDRIINGADITRLLVVTFTKAAASEMRLRISDSLSDALRKDPGNTHIRRQLAYLAGAHITTIHSFCMDIIKRYFYFADLNAGFRVADAAEAALLLSEAANEALEALCAEGNLSFSVFADSFSTQRSDEMLAEIGVSLYYFADSMAYPEKWLDIQTRPYEMTTADEFRESLICRTILESARERLCEAKGMLAFAQSFCAAEPELEDYRAMFENDVTCVNNLLSFCGDYDRLRNALSGFSFTRRTGAKNAPDELKERAASIRDDAKKIIKELYAKRFVCSAEENAHIMHDALPAVRGAVTLAARIKEIFTEKKRKKNILDYSDMVHITLSLLDDNGAPSQIARELRKSFDEIYIDEYQDTGDIEELIFGLISGRADGEPNVFMVGDIKQSIYGFRQADTELFAEKKRTYSADSEKNRKISLTRNFRSSEAVIEFINHVFSCLMSRDIGGVEYDEEERLSAGTAYPETKNPVEIAVIDVSDTGESTDDDDLTSVEAESLFIAEKISGMVGKEYVFDAKRGESRLMKYSDIAVISRSIKGTAPLIERVLTAKGIPVYSDSGGGFFETAEIESMLALLAVIDNPRNDIPLISALRMPTVGFDENMLTEVRLCKRRGDFYSALTLMATKDTDTGRACAAFLKNLGRWRFFAEQLPCDELLELLYNETGYMDFALSLPDGELRAANLRLLSERARQFEQTSFRGLFSFISYIDKVKTRSDTDTAKIIGEGHDVVRIMSIHKSKGLEFPVVFLVACGKRFNRRDETGKLIFHKKLGIGAEYVDTRLRCAYPTPAKAAVAAARRRDSISEELRVLYVALTRAKERLIITASTKNSEKMFMSWKTGSMLTKFGDSAFAGSLIDWIGSCLYSANCPLLPDRDRAYDGREILFGLHRAGSTAQASVESGNKLTEEFDENELEAALLYSYPHKDLAQIPSKISVSELKRLYAEEDSVYRPFSSAPVKKPRFIRESQTLSPTEKGTLTHFIMQTLPLPVNGIADVERHVAELAKRRIISEADVSEVPTEKIAAFFSSSIGKRMNAAKTVFRELPFTSYIKASSLLGDGADAQVFCQGIIDCCFFEDGKTVLVDYKTDRVKDKNSLKEKYRVQIEAYAEYLEKKYSRKCEKIIYLFDINDIICYD